MKKALSILIPLVLSLAISCAGAPETKKSGPIDAQKAISSYDFSVLAKLDEGKAPKFVIAIISDSTKIAEAQVDLSGYLQKAINDTGRVTLVDRNNIDKLLEEQMFALSGMTDSASVEIGELAGADFVLTCQVVSASSQKVDKVAYDAMVANIVLQMNLLNVSTSEVYKSFEGKGEASEKLITDADGTLIAGALDYANLYAKAIGAALEDLVPAFSASFPAIGFVLKADDSGISTDLGTNYMSKEGQAVAFISGGQAVVHPVTGEILNYEYEYYGYGIISGVQAKTSSVSLKEGTLPPAGSIAVLID